MLLTSSKKCQLVIVEKFGDVSIQRNLVFFSWWIHVD
uniref:Uncharacterized protein n=1 Tax=Nelumbo nucifera TaxID=4432 RepID=A0A822ZY76_NELNU|nr:TPA_asm: hypothetical protein HUJ06_018419 [Nelumbo nucifera]